MTSHVIAKRGFSVRTHLILIAFLRILIVYLHKYAAYLGCCSHMLSIVFPYSFKDAFKWRKTLILRG